MACIEKLIVKIKEIIFTIRWGNILISDEEAEAAAKAAHEYGCKCMRSNKNN